MIHQLKSVIGFQDSEQEKTEAPAVEAAEDNTEEEIDPDILKTRIETLDLTPRTLAALEEASIRTVGGLVRKNKDDILGLEGIGPKGVEEIEALLNDMGASLSE